MPLNPSRRPGNNRNTEQMRRWHNLLGREMAVMLDLRCFKEEAWVRSKRNPASAWNSHILKLTNTLACSHNQKWLNRWQQKTLRMKTSKAQNSGMLSSKEKHMCTCLKVLVEVTTTLTQLRINKQLIRLSSGKVLMNLSTQTIYMTSGVLSSRLQSSEHRSKVKKLMLRRNSTKPWSGRYKLRQVETNWQTTPSLCLALNKQTKWTQLLSSPETLEKRLATTSKL